MPDPSTTTTGPTVKTTPDFKVGETLACKSTGEEFKIIKINSDGNFVCAGRAGVMPKEAAQKPLTAAQKAELAAESDD